ncbi:hypothetical protein JNO12_25015 [Erwinia aphidicola]|nr:hypothetical protein [Erwinia aphidicola]
MLVTQRAPKAIDTSSELNDLFRLTYALETAKDMQWTYRLLGDREWSGRYAVALSDGVNGIYLSRTSLDG